MIQEDYVTFEQAKALKELGFPIRHELTIHTFSEPWSSYEEEYEEIHYDKPIPPTQSLVQKWLRENTEKEMFIEILKIDLIHFCYRICYIEYDSYDECYFNERITSDFYTYKSPEEALSAGIDKCIEILKNK